MEKLDLPNRIKSAMINMDLKAEIYLYGSRARSDYKKESDWDPLVISPKNIGRRLLPMIKEYIEKIENRVIH